MPINDWSIKAIQDLVLEREEWEKKNLYATDSGKCPAGIYYQLIGAKATTPDSPRGLRRMEVGNMVEYNQIKKLRSLGILIEAQRRIADDEYNVSGRHDGLVISPTECTDHAKELIKRKKELFISLTAMDIIDKENLDKYMKKEMEREDFMKRKIYTLERRQELYDEDWKINQELLIPDPKNSLILMELKSIVESGFRWRRDEGKPLDEHRKQIMFYLWKLREIYPWIIGRIVYVDTSYQDILEFNVEFDENDIDNMKIFWKSINDAVKNKVPPPASPDVVKDMKSGKWKLNFQAEWCRYHIHCTGDPNWKTKALAKVEELNGPKKTRTKKT